MGSLKDFANEQGDFIRLADGDSFKGIYKSYNIVQTRWGKKGISYIFEVEIDGKSVNKEFNSASGSLARTMDDVGIGQEVTITRTGEGTDTKYGVVVSGKEMNHNEASPQNEDITPPPQEEEIPF